MIIGWYFVGFRLVFRQSCIKGHCSCHLEGIWGVFIRFSYLTCILGPFICHLDGTRLAVFLCLIVFCRLDIIMWISLPNLYIVSLLYQSYSIIIEWFVHHYQWAVRLIRGNESMEI